LSSSFLSVELGSMIAREMIVRYKIAREQTRRELEEKYKKPVFFAHELTSCALKRQLSKTLTEVDLSASFTPRMIVGEIVEYGLEQFMVRLGFTKPENPCVLELDNMVVAGSPDYISRDGMILIDVKYSKEPVSRDHHRARMQIYLTICNAEKGVLVYFSPSGIKSYEVSDKMEVQRIKILANSNSIPQYPWECGLCVFKDFCPQAGVM